MALPAVTLATIPEDFQVDSSDHAWVAGYTESSLDGNTNAGSFDLFLMKFDSSGVHQWTAQRGGPMGEYANVLQADVRNKGFFVGIAS